RKNLDCLNNFWTVAAPARADLLLCCPRNFLSDLRVQILTLALTLFCLNFLCWLCSSVLEVWLLLLILIWFGFLRVSVSPWWKFRLPDPQMLQIPAWQLFQALIPLLRGNINVRGSGELADAAHFVALDYFFPPAFLLGPDVRWFIDEDQCVRQKVEQCVAGAGIRVELPAGKDAHAGSSQGFADGFTCTFNASAGKQCVNVCEHLFAHWRFGQRQKDNLIHRRGGALRARIKFADGLYFIAEELDAQGAVGFRRVSIQQATAQRVLAGHLDNIHWRIAD